jgi:hypothetical protein
LIVFPTKDVPVVGGFDNQSDQPLSTVVESNVASVSGSPTGVWGAVVTGDGSPELQVNSEPWTTRTSVVDGDSVKLRLETSVGYATTQTAVLRVNGFRLEWPVTTTTFEFDPDAQAYITAVETADGEALEPAVRGAINAFVAGCKADGIWGAIKASVILAGARTLTGALVPLKGNAPTNFNFVSGDYNRTTGLVGDGSTKYLDSNRNNNADPQDNRHIAVRANMNSSATQLFLGGRGEGTGLGASLLGFNGTSAVFRSVPDTDRAETSGAASVGTATLFGISRAVAESYTARVSGSSAAITSASATPNSADLFVFAQNNQNLGPSTLSDARIAFYSIGEALDLTQLDARVTALINAYGAI